METNITDKYIAGFFDGDGCVVINKIMSHRRWLTYALMCAVSNKNYDVIKLIRHNYGGYIYKNSEDCYLLSISGRKVVVFLNNIVDYTIIKKQQIKIGLEFVEKCCGTRGIKANQLREQYYIRLKQMKRDEIIINS